MRPTTLLCAALALADGAFAVKLSPPTGLTKPRSFGFEKVRRNVDNIPKLRKRADTVTQYLDNMVRTLTTAVTLIINRLTCIEGFLILCQYQHWHTAPEITPTVGGLLLFHDEVASIIISCVTTVSTLVHLISGSKVQHLRCACNRRTLASSPGLSTSITLRHTRRLQPISASLMSTGSSPRVTMGRTFLLSQMARVLQVSNSELVSAPVQLRE